VRLDSGNLADDSRFVRAALDRGGLPDVRILASGDLDEFKIQDLLDAGAPIDGFGVGTSLGVGAGSVEQDIEGGALGGVYKSVQYVEPSGTVRPTVKVAGDKSTYPGKKEVYRVRGFEEDVMQLAHEPKPPRSERLLKPIIVDGELVPGGLPPLSEIRELAERNLAQLPERYHALIAEQPYPVRFSRALCDQRERAMQEHQSRVSPPPAEQATQLDGPPQRDAARTGGPERRPGRDGDAPGA
jgi:nicotinate phosphoribosyltransferase